MLRQQMEKEEGRLKTEAWGHACVYSVEGARVLTGDGE